MAGKFKAGDKVRWSYAGGHADGTVKEKFERRVQRTIKGSKIVRNGSKAKPAYLVEQEDGGRALKLGSELSAR